MTVCIYIFKYRIFRNVLRIVIEHLKASNAKTGTSDLLIVIGQIVNDAIVQLALLIARLGKIVYCTSREKR